MDINVLSVMPYFLDSVRSHLYYIEDWAKDTETQRRLVAASSAKKEQDRADILNASTDFSYTVNVNANGSSLDVSLERTPQYEDTQLLNDIAKETHILFESLLPNEIEYALQDCGQEIGEYLKPIVYSYIREKIAGGGL